MARVDANHAVIVGVIGLVLLAGCSGFGTDGQGGGGDEDGRAPPVEGHPRAGAAGTAFDGAPSRGPAASLTTRRAIVRTGRIAIEVGSFETARGTIAGATRAQGGFVAGSSRNVHTRGNESWTTGHLVLRVPGGNFSELKRAVEGVGAVTDAATNRTDVTEQLVDLEARLRNLRAERDRLRQLYERANGTEDVLAVGKRLSDVQEEIERLAARKRSLENRVAFSTLTVELTERPPGPGPVDTDRWYDVGVVNAFLSSLDGVVVSLRVLAVGLAYVLPYAGAFGVPLAGGWFVLRRRPWRAVDLLERW